MNAWAVFAETLDPATIRSTVLPPVRRVLAERFGSEQHNRMLEAHEVNRAEFAAHVHRNEKTLAGQRLDELVAEAAGWEHRYLDRHYRFTDTQIAVAETALRRAAA